MSETMTSTGRPRYAWAAVVLSLLQAGLGQIYCGRLIRGLLLAGLSAASLSVTAALLANDVPVGTPVLVTVGLLGLLGITVAAAADAWRLARLTRRDYRLKECNRVAVYLLVYLLAKGGQVGALLYARDHELEAFRVPSTSMSPAIQAGDRVLGNKAAYTRVDPQRGDVVIFRDPEHWRGNCIKRIVALAGDTVEIREGRLMINGRLLDRLAVPGGGGGEAVEVNPPARYRILPAGGGIDRKVSGGAITVPANHCYVMGDHRGPSRDSRDFGPIPLSTLVARADYLYWPAGGWARFGRLGE
jgi:signal peptidase I